MSHTKWHWRVRQRAVGHFSCIDVRTMAQKMEKGRRTCALTDHIENRGLIQKSARTGILKFDEIPQGNWFK